MDYALSTSASGFTVGDFNGDGKLDVITVDPFSLTSASIFLGNGDGTLQTSVPLNPSVGQLYSTVVPADFNGDGKLDLVFLAPNFGGGSTMAVIFGNGDGSYQNPITYSVPVAPFLSVSDFNHDNKLDIAICGGTGISILINNGDGTFKSPTNYSIAGGAEAFSVADLNADGKMDLIVPSGGNSATISVLLGNGDGTFGSAIEYTSNLLSIYATSIAATDFNGDGKLDLALTSSAGTTMGVAIVLGNGDGTFQNPPIFYGAGTFSGHIEYGVPSLVSNVSFMEAADFNGDGALDMALVDFSPSEVTVFLNQPVAAFAPRSLKFANQGLDMTSAEQGVTLSNAGAAPLAVTSIATSGDFVETNDCGSSVGIRKACTVRVTFAPTADGIRSGTLTFTDNASVVPQVLALSGTGIGAGFQMSVAPVHPLRRPFLPVKRQATRWSLRRKAVSAARSR